MNNVSTIALAQLVTGSTNFCTIGIACIDNFAVFVTSLLRGRLNLEMGAMDALAMIRSPKIEYVNSGFVLMTSVDYFKDSMVMMSNYTPNISIKKFMVYISNSYNMHSFVL